MVHCSGKFPRLRLIGLKVELNRGYFPISLSEFSSFSHQADLIWGGPERSYSHLSDRTIPSEQKFVTGQIFVLDNKI